jgi:hypothetical protein
MTSSPFYCSDPSRRQTRCLSLFTPPSQHSPLRFPTTTSPALLLRARRPTPQRGDQPSEIFPASSENPWIQIPLGQLKSFLAQGVLIRQHRLLTLIKERNESTMLLPDPDHHDASSAEDSECLPTILLLYARLSRIINLRVL